MRSTAMVWPIIRVCVALWSLHLTDAASVRQRTGAKLDNFRKSSRYESGRPEQDSRGGAVEVATRDSEQRQPAGAVRHDFCLPSGTLLIVGVRSIAGNPSGQVQEHGRRVFVRRDGFAEGNVSQVLQRV